MFAAPKHTDNDTTKTQTTTTVATLKTALAWNYQQLQNGLQSIKEGFVALVVVVLFVG